MNISKFFCQRREISSNAIILVGILAIVLVVSLWVAGADSGAMKILLGSLVFGLTAYLSYLSNPREGEVSLTHGGLGGGILALVYVPFVVCKHSYETRGVPLPNSLFEVVMLAVSLLLFIPFGAVMGGMIVLIGDSGIRAAQWLGRRWSSAKNDEAKADRSRKHPLF